MTARLFSTILASCSRIRVRAMTGAPRPCRRERTLSLSRRCLQDRVTGDREEPVTVRKVPGGRKPNPTGASMPAGSGARLARPTGDTDVVGLAHYQAGFIPLLYGVLLAVILSFFLKETGPATKKNT